MLDQRPFLNCCVRIETELAPEALLDVCKEIERALGRAPGGVRHGPRPIDVDVLLLGDVELESERLTLPHAEVTSRRFVLVPLLELDPDARGPGLRPRGGRARRDRGPGGPARRPAARRATVAADAARRRRRQHADPSRDVPGRRAARALALRHRARVDGGRARRRPARAARPARGDVRPARRVDRVVHRPRAGAGVGGDGGALPRPRDAGRRPGPADRHADPDRQPARGGRRPARQLRRGPRPLRRAVRGGRLRDRPQHRHRLARRRVHRRHDRARDRDLDGRADRARAPSSCGSSWRRRAR